MSNDKLLDGWKRVKLGDVVEQTKDRVDSSAESASVYVPGGSIGRGTFTITEWLPVDDGLMGPAFHMVCRSGDVLYKSRVPHGVAVSDRSGICANTTYVLRTRDESVLLQDLLPHLLSTDSFLNHESLNDKGSTNLYLNFSDIAKYEFALPPIDEQQQIVEVLRAVDTLSSRLRGSTDLIGDVEAAIVAEVARTEDAPEMSLQSCCAAPISYGIVQPGLDVPDGIPYINVEDMTAGPLSRDTLPRTLPAISARHGRTLLQPGDVVVALRGPIGLAVVASEELAEVNLSRGVARLHPTPAVDGGYLALCLSSPTFRAQIRSVATGSTFKELKIGALRELRVPVPSLDRQREIADSVGRVRRAEAATAAQIATTVEIRQGLRNSLLQGAVDVR